MQMGVAADLQIGEDDHHMSTSNIWLNMRSASCKAAAQSTHCDGNKKTTWADNKASVADSAKKKQLCLCAPTTHAGSFKCRLHRATGTANSTTHKPLASSSVNKKSFFSSRNMAQSRIGDLDFQSQPHLSRFGRAVAAASGSVSQPISAVLQMNEQFYEPHQDATE